MATITQDMKYRQSLMCYAIKYGISRYISRLLHDTFCLSANSLLVALAAGDIVMGREAFVIMLFYQDRFSPQTSLFGNTDTASVSFENGVSLALSEHFVSFVAEVDGFIVALVSLPQSFPVEDEEKLYEFYQTCTDVVEPVINVVEERDYIRFRCLYTGPVTSISMLHAHDDLLYGSWQFRKFFLGTQPSPVFTRIGGTPQSAHETAELYCGDAAKRLCSLIKESSLEDALDCAEEAIDRILTLEPQTFNGLRINLQCFCTSLRYALLMGNVTVVDGIFGDHSASLIRSTDYNTLRRNFLAYISAIYNSFRKQFGSMNLTGIMRYIDENISEQWLSVQVVGEHFGVNPSLLSTQFKTRTGQRPIDYIHSKRLEYAIGLLTKTNMSVKGVSEASGYGSIATMNRAFRNYAGMTPSWFKKQAVVQGLIAKPIIQPDNQRI